MISEGSIRRASQNCAHWASSCKFVAKVASDLQKPDGSHETISLTPQRAPGDARGFLGIGVGPAFDLAGAVNTESSRAKTPKLCAVPPATPAEAARMP